MSSSNAVTRNLDYSLSLPRVPLSTIVEGHKMLTMPYIQCKLWRTVCGTGAPMLVHLQNPKNVNYQRL